MIMHFWKTKKEHGRVNVQVKSYHFLLLMRFQRKSRPIQHYGVSGTVIDSTSTGQSSSYSSDSEAVQSESSGHKSTFTQEIEPSNQNRLKWTNLAKVCERYNLSDRAGAAVATCDLQNIGMIDKENFSVVIDRSKLRRERKRYRKETQETEHFKYVNGLYFDGRKDATLAMVKAPNGKFYMSTKLEEHFVLMEEPGEYYLTHLSNQMEKVAFWQNKYLTVFLKLNSAKT